MLQLARESKTYAEMGLKLGVSKQRIHQLLVKTNMLAIVKPILRANKTKLLEDRKVGCVYELLVNDARYIGSTLNYTRRKCQHRTTLKTNQHTNAKLQEAYNSTPKTKIIFNILEKSKDKLSLLTKECYYIGITTNVNTYDAIMNNAKPHSTKYKGISYHEHSGKYLVRPHKNGTYHYLGYTNTQEEGRLLIEAWDKDYPIYKTLRKDW